MSSFYSTKGSVGESGCHPLVIVGGGAAGLYLASCLEGKRPILMLESGAAQGFNGRDPRNAVYTHGAYAHGQTGRARGVGGTTNLWGGQMLPFTPADITAEKGWPFEYSHLEPHYEAVSRLLLGEPSTYGHTAASRTKRSLPTFEDEAFYIHLSKWLSNPRFRQTLLPQLKRHSVDIRSNCTVQAIEPLDSGHYRLHCENDNKVFSHIDAVQIVLATGTIETLRLLLVSRDRFQLPVSGALGLGFMDHVAADVCELAPLNRFRLQRWFNTRRAAGRTRYSIRLSARHTWLEKTGHHNASAMIVVRQPAQRWQQAFNAITAAWSLIFGRFVFKPFGAMMLNVMVEQQSTDESRKLTLSADHFPVIDWHPSISEAATACSLAREVAGALHQQGCLRRSPGIMSPSELVHCLEDVCHPMGGACMHHQPSKRVVSEQLELIGCNNLFIASAAVFPSGSHSNPTMTLLALVSRLAARLLSDNRDLQ
jgi:choline dehydrogenase-like flavoprotein